MGSFFILPYDIRTILYDLVLADARSVLHSRQPSNSHFRLLHASGRIYREARDPFHRYVSLRNEFQVERFYQYISSSPETALSVRWADVAIPSSQLYRTLAKLSRLETLRVFDARHYHPFTMNVPQLRYRRDFEGAVFPASVHKDSVTLPYLTSYELYLDPSTRVAALDCLPGNSVHTLRLSGDCQIAANASFPALRRLVIHSVTSNTFDRIKLDCIFADSQLQSFTHAQGHRLGFEIRNTHLESLVSGPGRCLRKLVLLGSARLSSAVIASCLRNLPMLEYFALSLVTVNELRENFILSLGPFLRTLKLQVIHAWYAVPLFREERVICNSLEERMLFPKSPLSTIYVSFHSRIMTEDEREERWKRIAHAQRLTLMIGPWEDDEDT